MSATDNVRNAVLASALVLVSALAVLLLVGISSAEAKGKKPPKFSRAAAQRAATQAAPRMLSNGGSTSHTDSDGSYTITYAPQQFVAVNGCSKALALGGDAFGCHMIVQQSDSLTAATGTYATNPPTHGGTFTSCHRLTLNPYRGKRSPDVFQPGVDGIAGYFQQVTVPFKKPYKVAVALFSEDPESCPPGVGGA